MPDIRDIGDLCALVASGFTGWEALGQVRVRAREGLLVFDYTAAAAARDRFNPFERMSRGLILDASDGAILARPFDKFWGWGEGGRRTDAPLVRVTRKADGSLGIVLRREGRAVVATRSGPWSEPATRATAALRAHDLSGVDPDWTLLLEILDPQQPKIFDRADRIRLVLLAARSRSSGAYAPGSALRALADATGLPLTPALPLATLDAVLAAAQTVDDTEGFVTEHADGARFKIKTRAYLDTLSATQQLSPRRVARKMRAGELAAYRASLDPALHAALDAMAQQIRDEVSQLRRRIEQIHDTGPAPQAAFGAWVKANHPELRRYLLAHRRGEDLQAMILRRRS